MSHSTTLPKSYTSFLMHHHSGLAFIRATIMAAISPDDLECLHMSMRVFLSLLTWPIIQNQSSPSNRSSGRRSSMDIVSPARRAMTNAKLSWIRSNLISMLISKIKGLPPVYKNRVYFHVIRLGVKSRKSPLKIEMQKDDDGKLITSPPDLKNLGMRQRSFKKSVYPFIWNYIVENRCEDDDDSENAICASLECHPGQTIPTTPRFPTEAPTTITPIQITGNKKRKLNEAEPTIAH